MPVMDVRATDDTNGHRVDAKPARSSEGLTALTTVLRSQPKEMTTK
jgi:hypothetical protein